MSYRNDIVQQTPEWWKFKTGKVSGTRFGQLISTRENSLLFEMANEILDGAPEQTDFENEDMLFGIEQEKHAIDALEAYTGLTFLRGGVLVSDRYPDMHMASPDGITADGRVVAEVKSTMHGKTQIKRFIQGVDSSMMGQIINYFAVEDKVEKVIWASWCPFRRERPLVVYEFTRNSVIESKETKKDGLIETTIQDKVDLSHTLLAQLGVDLKNVIEQFTTIKF